MTGSSNGEGNNDCDGSSHPALSSRRKRKIKVLTVGEGDLTLSLALARAYGDRSIDLTASVLEGTKEILLKSFPNAPVSDLEDNFNVPIFYGIDATQLHRRQSPPRQGCAWDVQPERELPSSHLFDLVTFHHPHLGLGSLQDDEAGHALRHYQLLCHYLYSAGRVSKLVHVCLCGTQPETWRLLEAAQRQGMVMVESPIQTTAPFSQIWKTIQDNNDDQDGVDGLRCTNEGKSDSIDKPAHAEPHFAAPRRFRNGRLGSRHFLGKYGYRHRRTEGDNYNGLSSDMNVSGSMHYVFTAAAHDTGGEVSDNSRQEDKNGFSCTICGASFESESDLELHLNAPSLPSVAKSTINFESRSQESPNCGADVTEPAESTSSTVLTQIMSNQKEEQQPIERNRQHQIDQSWIVPQGCEDKRLRRFIHRHVKNSSKRQAETMILAGLVLVNGTVALDSSRLLREHDTVETVCKTVTRQTMNEGPTDTETTTTKATVYIVKRCDDWLVAWKPSGVRTKGEFPGTLEASISKAEDKLYRSHSALDTSCPGLCVLSAISNDHLLLNGTTSLSVHHTMTILIHGHVPESWYPRRCAILTLAGKWKNRNTTKRKYDQDLSSSSTQIELSTFSIEIIPKESTPTVHDGDKEGTTAPSLTGLSTVEVVTEVPSSHSLCKFFRQEGVPIVGDSLCRKEYLTLKRSIRNRLKSKLMMGCYKVEIKSSKNAVGSSILVERSVPDKLSAQFWETFLQVETGK